MIVDSKTKMYRLLRQGEFGNTFKNYTSVREVMNSDLKQISVRYSDRSKNGKSFFEVTDKEHLNSVIEKFVKNGAERGKICFNNGDFSLQKKIVIQGELCEIDGMLELAFSTREGITLREATNRGLKRTCGLTVKYMLQHYLWPSDYDWLFELLDKYPGHVIEFTTFSIPVGVIRNRCTVIWEVRKY